jgi:hypothetical protein
MNKRTPFTSKKAKTYHLLSEEDGHRIDGLICTLAMAVRDILELRTVNIPASPLNGPDLLAEEMFCDEVNRIHEERLKQVEFEF